MKKSRKTVEVEFIVSMYNSNCAASAYSDGAKVALEGMSSIVSNILHRTGNYHGFIYVDTEGKTIGLDHPEFNEYRRRYL